MFSRSDGEPAERRGRSPTPRRALGADSPLLGLPSHAQAVAAVARQRSVSPRPHPHFGDHHPHSHAHTDHHHRTLSASASDSLQGTSSRSSSQHHPPPHRPVAPPVRVTPPVDASSSLSLSLQGTSSSSSLSSSSPSSPAELSPRRQHAHHRGVSPRRAQRYDSATLLAAFESQSPGTNASPSPSTSALTPTAASMPTPPARSRPPSSPVRAPSPADAPSSSHSTEESLSSRLFVNAMLTSLRYCVNRSNSLGSTEGELPPQAYSKQIRHSLYVDQDSESPASHSSSVYQCKGYAPLVFRSLREIVGVSNQSFVLSFANEVDATLVAGEGKSGAFFYMTADKRFLIKSIRPAESRTLRNVLPDYRNTLKESIQYTLLPVYLGLYKLKRGLRKTFLVVMENLFRSSYPLVERYDVKGSWVGRKTETSKPAADADHDATAPASRSPLPHLHTHTQTIAVHAAAVAAAAASRVVSTALAVEHSPPEAERRRQESQAAQSEASLRTLKDQDMLRRGRRIVLSRQALSLFSVQLKKDLEFLARSNLMDYSLLIGMARAPTQLVEAQRPMAADVRYFYKDDGGIVGRVLEEQAAEKATDQGPYLYFMGIIDILQPWDVRKLSENAMKRLYQDARGISAIRPAEYATRFEAFLQQVVVAGI